MDKWLVKWWKWNCIIFQNLIICLCDNQVCLWWWFPIKCIIQSCWKIHPKHSSTQKHSITTLPKDILNNFDKQNNFWRVNFILTSFRYCEHWPMAKFLQAGHQSTEAYNKNWISLRLSKSINLSTHPSVSLSVSLSFR